MTAAAVFLVAAARSTPSVLTEPDSTSGGVFGGTGPVLDT
jgi:hypothetical protein